MFAVVEIAGTQIKVAEKEKVYVPKLDSEVGTTVRFDKVLLKAGDRILVGSPYLTGSFVEATVLEHTKDNKVIVFKKKRRKGYKVTRGHRQQYTILEITKVS